MSAITRCAQWRLRRARCRRRLGGRFPRYPLVSCNLIGRLAIAKDQQGQRLGSVLLADALQRAYESANTVGSSMVIVDALDEVAAGFYAVHGFVRLPDSLSLVMPIRQADRGSERCRLCHHRRRGGSARASKSERVSGSGRDDRGSPPRT